MANGGPIPTSHPGPLQITRPNVARFDVGVGDRTPPLHQVRSNAFHSCWRDDLCLVYKCYAGRSKQAVSFLPFRVRTFGQHPGRQQLLEPATPHRARMPWLHEPIVTIPTATAFLCWFCLPSPLPPPAPYKTTQYMHTDRTSPKNVFAREEKRTLHCRNAKWQPLPFNTSHSLRPGVKNLRAGQICCFPHASTTILRF